MNIEVIENACEEMKAKELAELNSYQLTEFDILESLSYRVGDVSDVLYKIENVLYHMKGTEKEDTEEYKMLNATRRFVDDIESFDIYEDSMGMVAYEIKMAKGKRDGDINVVKEGANDMENIINFFKNKKV